jgi:hypothetical protein
MAATPKAKPDAAPTPTRREDRTSAVVTATLILLTVVGGVTVFWEPLAAIAGGAPTADSVAETRAAAPDAGASPSTNAAAAAMDAAGSS